MNISGETASARVVKLIFLIMTGPLSVPIRGRHTIYYGCNIVRSNMICVLDMICSLSQPLIKQFAETFYFMRSEMRANMKANYQ